MFESILILGAIALALLAMSAGTGYIAMRHVKPGAKRMKTDDRAFVGSAGVLIGALVGLAIAIVFILALMPTVTSSAAAVNSDPNASTAVKSIVALYPLMYAVIPILGIVGGGYIGGKKAGVF